MHGREGPAWAAMSDSRPHPTRLRRGLAFASSVEFATGLALWIDPARVVQLLLGMELAGAAALLARCFGIALLALALACWPPRGGSAAPAVRGMLTYNALIALCLGWLGVAGQAGGLLLWPAAVLHLAVAAWIGWAALER